MAKYLSDTGLGHLIDLIKTALNGKSDTGHTHTPASIGAAASNHTHTPASIGAATSGHTHSNATSSQAGFMSAADKSKLDGLGSSENPCIVKGFGVGHALQESDVAFQMDTVYGEYDPDNIIYHPANGTYIRIPGNRRFKVWANLGAHGLNSSQNLAVDILVGTTSSPSSAEVVASGIQGGGETSASGISSVGISPVLVVPESTSSYRYIKLAARSTGGGGNIRTNRESYLGVEVLGEI